MADNKSKDDAGTVEHADPDQEAPSVKGAHRAGSHKDVKGGRPDGDILTSQPHREADKTSSPVPNDAKAEDPPVRTTRPDVAIAVSMATGAGQHEPPDLDEYTPEGRPRNLPGSAE